MTDPEAVRAALTRLSAVLGCGGEGDWRGALEEARGLASDVEIEEVLLQSYLFLGFPAAINALIVWRDVSGVGPAASRRPRAEECRRRGEDLCRRVYGEAYDRLRDVIGRLHPDLDRWMIEEGYGRTLSRPGLGAVERELCAVALLAAAGHERQLRAHLRGAANLGAAPGAIEEALGAGCDAREVRGLAERSEIERLRASWREMRAGSDR